MNRRQFLLGAGAMGLAGARPGLAEAHFPDRLHQFVWRNWELANTDAMARVVRCRERDILRIGRSLGLPAKPRLTPDQLRRIYITVIRQNWSLLSNEQIIQLLGWTPAQFEFTLKEDDFLSHKLGAKPECAPLVYAPPANAARRRAAEIAALMRRELGSELAAAGEPPFAFIAQLSDRSFHPLRDPAARAAAGQVDAGGWRVEGDHPRAVEWLRGYLRTAMQAAPRKAKGRLVFRSAPGEGFSATVSPDEVVIEGNALQGAYWLADCMEERGGPFLTPGRTERQAGFNPRYLYSYFALYGDPLLEPGIDPFPEGYLEKLARAGINGVWMQCILNRMARSPLFPEFGDRSEERLARLSALTRRLRQSGFGLYLYINEPRAMPAAFYRNRPQMRGAEERGYFAMCTSAPEVREWISASLAHVFSAAPDLAGIFTITMSENLTNCYSRGRGATCPRCSRRKNWEVVAEQVQAIRDGVRRSSRNAAVIVWDWAWPDEMARNAIPKLPRDVRFLSVSEWSTPVERGGVKTKVGEYSISVVGPGPRATAHWALARQAGLGIMAKTQFNNSWEISAVPYIPVAPLVARHCANLVAAGVGGIMPAWTPGGYPSPNLEVAREFYFARDSRAEDVLEKVARRRYGTAAAPGVLQAWQSFSKAFQEFPYGVAIYVIPTQHGPANLLRPKPSGVPASMILFPQDDYKRWCGPYPPEVARRQFDLMATQWEQALEGFRRALERVPPSRRESSARDLAIAETCGIHFRSTANQIEFYMLRGSPASAARHARMRALVEAELALARRLYPIARRHSIIAYEASNHYYYRPLDLAEKMVQCRWMLEHDSLP